MKAEKKPEKKPEESLIDQAVRECGSMIRVNQKSIRRILESAETSPALRAVILKSIKARKSMRLQRLIRLARYLAEDA